LGNIYAKYVEEKDNRASMNKQWKRPNNKCLMSIKKDIQSYYSANTRWNVRFWFVFCFNQQTWKWIRVFNAGDDVEKWTFSDPARGTIDDDGGDAVTLDST
jgi:hypothetical protein